MSNYIYKLNGKTIKATNAVTGEPTVIAFAPFWIKPWGSTYTKLDAIQTYKNEYPKWLSSAERKEVNKCELNAADIPTSRDPHFWELSPNRDAATNYWKLKRKVLNAEKFEKNFEAAGIKHVMFVDRIEDIKNSPVTLIHKLNGAYYFDEQAIDFGTPVMGQLTVVNGKYIFTPNTETVC